MSQSPSVGTRPRPQERSSKPVESEEDVQCLLEALDDADCRDILDATGNDALSASEVSERCDLPLSTTYRKLEILDDAGLLVERTRINHTGKHVSEYVRAIDDVTVSVDSKAGIQIEVSVRDGIDHTTSL
jgi:predicted transcriptional regulator